MSKIVDGLLYSESHEWVKVDGNVAIIGVSDFAQSEMGDITYVDMPDIDDEFSAGDEFGALESVKTSSELITPVSGKVIARNDELEDKPELINEDAYRAWIIKIEMSDKSELDSLLSSGAYADIAK
ncbi:MAG TPA: glycine cleavage system protein GcvH [Rikenellaceae bacterium]|nr:glycine cleavage system protein GcvH [Rikenellaceae bacterium]HBH21192.1 glycine cleavage system protein GcvH [Rikenellaceae bacterium]HCZ23236.1 glycine cleavage system protein GcvH [Rikenellaceae bacterium]